MLDKDGKVITWNEGAKNINGYEADEIIGRNFSIFYPEELKSNNHHKYVLEEAKNKGRHEEEGYRITKEGNKIYVNVIVSAIRTNEGELIGFTKVSRNLTEKLESEKREKEISRQVVEVMNATPIVIWTAKPDGAIDFYNESWYNYTGLSFEDTNEWGWKIVVHPDDLQACLDLWLKCLSTGNPYLIECRWKSASGEYRWHSLKALPLLNEKGEIIKWIGSGGDIHEQKILNEETQRQNKELRKINEDLDNFVYTASHDLKAPIANLEALLSALCEAMEIQFKEEEKGLITMMETSIQKFKMVIEELSQISRVQKLNEDDFEKVSVKEIFDEIKVILNKQIKESGVKIDKDLQEQELFFSRKNFRSILFNLVSNAIKYGHPERKPLIEIKTFSEGDFFVLQVKDNGLGIDLSKKERLFQMFKRLHDHVEGSGVGLYIVKRISDNAGGRIDVESEIGKGSVFTIYLPKQH